MFNRFLGFFVNCFPHSDNQLSNGLKSTRYEDEGCRRQQLPYTVDRSWRHYVFSTERGFPLWEIFRVGMCLLMGVSVGKYLTTYILHCSPLFRSMLFVLDIIPNISFSILLNPIDCVKHKTKLPLFLCEVDFSFFQVLFIATHFCNDLFQLLHSSSLSMILWCY